MIPSTKTESAGLVDALRADSGRAFETLVGRYKTYVYSVAYGYVHNFTDAEEIAQMVFVEVYEHIKELKEPDKLINWLHGITDRVSLNWLRKYRKRTVSLDNLETEIAAKQADPHNILLAQEKAEATTNTLMGIYDALEPDQRTMLNLRYMENLSYEEIARALGVSRDAVRGRLYRAHQALRGLLR